MHERDWVLDLQDLDLGVHSRYGSCISPKRRVLKKGHLASSSCSTFMASLTEEFRLFYFPDSWIHTCPTLNSCRLVDQSNHFRRRLAFLVVYMHTRYQQKSKSATYEGLQRIRRATRDESVIYCEVCGSHSNMNSCKVIPLTRSPRTEI